MTAPAKPSRLKRLRRLVLWAALAVGLAAGSLLAWVATGALASDSGADCIFVPGAAVRPGRNPSDALQYRLEAALELYRAGRAPLLVVAGGGQGDYAEAEVMAQWLLENGVPPGAIIKEATSRTTRENARNAAPMMRERGIRTALVSTQWFHVQRTRAALRQEGFETFAAPCGGQVLVKEPYFAAREMLALPIYALGLDPGS